MLSSDQRGCPLTPACLPRGLFLASENFQNSRGSREAGLEESRGKVSTKSAEQGGAESPGLHPIRAKLIRTVTRGRYGVPLFRFIVQLCEKLVTVEFPSGVISIYSSLNGGGNFTFVKHIAVFVK